MKTRLMYGYRWRKSGKADEAYTTLKAAKAKADALRKSGLRVHISRETAKRGPFKGMTLYEVYYRK